MRHCSKCDKFKEFSEFGKNKSMPDGYSWWCKDCIREDYQKNKTKRLEYHQNNKERLNQKSRDYHKQNKHEILKRKKKYYYNNVEKEAIRNKKYRKNNIDKIKSRVKKYYNENKEKLNKGSHEYRMAHRDYFANLNLVKKYGITLEIKKQMMLSQNNKCANKHCNYEFKTTVDAHVDHCHKSGKVRGILCDTCNRGLGYFHDSIDKLEGIKDYLKKHSENNK